ncbi:PilZ domain-containing protein [Hwanghaeella sp.]|uniref:PilZ domain-containing protein n=1 Tax=Hwanghaeella sp. TaxID=2605943 RepID=UPI003CCBC7B7
MADTFDRKEERIQNDPIPIQLEGKKYRLHDWSAGGFSLKAYHRDIVPGEVVEGRIGSLFGLPRSAFKAVVVWRKQQSVGFSFQQLRSETFAAMRERATARKCRR